MRSVVRIETFEADEQSLTAAGFEQGARDSVPDRSGLAADSSTLDICLDIKPVLSLSQLKRLSDDQLQSLPAEIFVHRPIIDNDLARTGLHPYPCNRSFSPSFEVYARGFSTNVCSLLLMVFSAIS
jgi:hypothetical protein